MIKMIISDLDGTLLYGRDNTVSEEMFELIREMKKKGILFAAASGRQYHNLKNLFAPVWEDMAFVTENGAVAFYKDQMIAQKIAPQEELMKMLYMIDEDEDTEVALSSATTTYIRPKSQEFKEAIIKLGNQMCEVKEWADVTEPCVKLAWFDKNGSEERMKYWQSRLIPPAKIATSGNSWMDILYPDTHKGTGIEILEQYFGIKKEEMAAFGDNDNDKEMLEIVGYPIAMDNSREEILRMCPYHTTRVEDMVRKILDGEFPNG